MISKNLREEEKSGEGGTINFGRWIGDRKMSDLKKGLKKGRSVIS